VISWKIFGYFMWKSRAETSGESWGKTAWGFLTHSRGFSSPYLNCNCAWDFASAPIRFPTGRICRPSLPRSGSSDRLIAQGITGALGVHSTPFRVLVPCLKTKKQKNHHKDGSFAIGGEQRPSASDSLRSLLSVLPAKQSLGQNSMGLFHPLPRVRVLH